MYKVRRGQLSEERRENIGEKDESFGYVGPDEVLSGGEDDDIQDIVD